jgi:DNA transposition AAA+ family ATPase
MKTQDELKKLIKEKEYTLSYVSRAINMSNATLHLWLSGTYTGNVKKVDEAVKNFLEIEKLREKKISIEFVNTSIVEDVYDVARVCHVDGEIGVCCGEPGVGKTYAVKKYAIENTDVILIEADLGYTTKVLFSEIHKKLGFDGLGTIHNMLQDIITKLKSSGRLIIIDEAEHLPYKALDLLRRIYDKANIGILLVGMPRLIMNLRGEKRQYAQLFSRVGIATKLTGLTQIDMKEIVRSVLPDSRDVFKLLTENCAGNTRVLVKLLVRAIKLAQINNTKIDKEIIQASVNQIII